MTPDNFVHRGNDSAAAELANSQSFLKERCRFLEVPEPALPLKTDQPELLIEASQAERKDVEPAIFGTLLERALDPHERHKLGARYTPRAYVERLVMPTIIEPLRDRWDETYAAASSLRNEDDSAGAIQLIRDFHGRLCDTRVLDPACGSGNFLHVATRTLTP